MSLILWTKICKTQYSLAKKLNHTFRFIDDLGSFNSDGNFQKVTKDIYPPCLKLNKENESDNDATLLDINIKVRNQQFETKLFDKRDAFGFTIVNYPDLSGNIPKRTSYGVFISQLLRFAIACMFLQDFIERSHNLIGKLISQGYTKEGLHKTFSKFHRKYNNVLEKYNCPQKIMAKKLFDN